MINEAGGMTTGMSAQAWQRNCRPEHLRAMRIFAYARLMPV
jgi:hypothetical protein